MGSIDRPRTPGGDVESPNALRLVRVGRRDGPRSALVAVAAVTVLLATAVWKPWDGGATSGRPAGATGLAGAGGALLPAATSRSGEPTGTTPFARLRPPPTRFAALDLQIMGTADPHDAWGVGVGYVSRPQFDNAAGRGSSFVTPVVSWELIEPGRDVPGPTLDHANVTTVAIAATWPAGTRPIGIQLRQFGPPGAELIGRPAPVELGVPLASRVWIAAGAGGGSGTAFGMGSGEFYLPSSMPAGDPVDAADWIGHGWPAGRYAFEVELEGGFVMSVPFTLGASAEP